MSFSSATKLGVLLYDPAAKEEKKNGTKKN